MKDNKSASIKKYITCFDYTFTQLLNKVYLFFEISLKFAAKFEEYESYNKNKQR